MGHPQTSPVSLAHRGQVSTTWRDQALVSGQQGGRGRGSPHHLDTHADGGKTDPLKTQTGLQVQPGQQRSKRVRVHVTACCGEAGRPTAIPRKRPFLLRRPGEGPSLPDLWGLSSESRDRPQALRSDRSQVWGHEGSPLLAFQVFKTFTVLFFLKQHIKA